MVVLRASELAASGYMVIADHPWKTGDLKRIAKKLGIVVPPDAVVLRIPPPWSEKRDYLEAASTNQLKAMLEFGKVASETAGLPLDERLITIRNKLKGKTYGRKPQVKAPRLPNVEKELARRQRLPIPEATAATVLV